VELPIGWKKRSTGHSMWNDLVDDKGRVRATFFYKAAFYDRDAFINFERRYDFRTVTSLPTDQRGHYEMQKVKSLNPAYANREDREDIIEESDGKHYVVYRDDPYGMTMVSLEKYILTEEKVWVSNFRNGYQERNNTPFYFEVTDGEKVIHTTKETPTYFKKRYAKNYHKKWWKESETITDGIRQQAIQYLDANFPGWNDINSYWD